MNKLQKDLRAVAKEEAKRKDRVAMETFAQTFTHDNESKDKRDLCRKLLQMIDGKYNLTWLEDSRNSFRCPSAIGHRGTSPYFKGTKKEWEELANELIWVEEKLKVELAIQEIGTENFMREVMDLLEGELEIHDNRVDQDPYKSLQQDITRLNFAVGIALLTIFIMGILIVITLI